jgi:dephospho-CoA kinase
MATPTIVGLTGPLGAGKRDAAPFLRRGGAYIIYVDELAHELYRPQTFVWQELVKTFGSKILLRGGKINRPKLGKLVFSEKEKLQKLNRIVHPFLKKEIIKRIEENKTLNPEQLIVVNAALPQLFEGLVDAVWVILARQEVRVARLLKSGLSKAEARKRILAQGSRKEYLKIADVVIHNNGSLKQLHAKIQNSLPL